MKARGSCTFSPWRRSFCFWCVHVVMALLVPKTLRAMIRGR